MSKWGDRRVNRPERIVSLDILPVPVSLDGRKIWRVIWGFLRWILSLPKLIGNQWMAFAKTEHFDLCFGIFSIVMISIFVSGFMCLLGYIIIAFIKAIMRC